MKKFFRSADKFGFRRRLLSRVITENRFVFDSGSFAFSNDGALNHSVTYSRLRVCHHKMLIIIHIFIKFALEVLKWDCCFWPGNQGAWLFERRVIPVVRKGFFGDIKRLLQGRKYGLFVIFHFLYCFFVRIRFLELFNTGFNRSESFSRGVFVLQF